jgi:hypothetical protein
MLRLMKKSTLFKAIDLLSPDEFLELGHFVRSPFFNKSNRAKQVEKLYDYIYANQNKPAALEKEKALAVLWPEKQITDLQKNMSELLRVAEQYMAWQQVFGETKSFSEVQLASLSFINKKNGQDNNALIQKTKKAMEENAQIKDINYYYNLYRLETELNINQTAFNDKTSDVNLIKSMQALDDYYLISKLQMACNLKIQSRFTPIDTAEPFLIIEELIKIKPKETFLTVPLLGIMKDTFELLTTDDVDVFFSLSSSMAVSGHTVPADLAKLINNCLRNFCTARYNKGDMPFLDILFSLMKAHLADGSLYEKGKLNPGSVHNIVNTGLKLSEFDWVIQFIESHKDSISGTDNPDEVYHFQLAIYYFATAQYQLSLDTLPESYADNQYEFASKRLRTKAYFELKSPLFLPTLDAFKMYVHREKKRGKITDFIFEANNIFIRTIAKIDNLPDFGSKAELLKIKDQIKETTHIAEREWLLAQC